MCGAATNCAKGILMLPEHRPKLKSNNSPIARITTVAIAGFVFEGKCAHWLIFKDMEYSISQLESEFNLHLLQLSLVPRFVLTSLIHYSDI